MKTLKFKINGNPYEVEVKNVEGKLADVEVNGKLYKVELEKEVEAPKVVKRSKVVATAKESEAPKAAGSANTTPINAPLPGIIFSMKVKEGDKVSKGDTLLILEAMKMENNIAAEVDGVVASIKVKEGDSVLQNETLVEIA